MSNNKAPKAATYVQPDLPDGDYSIAELQKRNSAQFEEANKANMATWDKQESLTAAQIKVLDGVSKGNHEGIRWDSIKRNSIGGPLSLSSKPRVNTGESKPATDVQNNRVKGK